MAEHNYNDKLTLLIDLPLDTQSLLELNEGLKLTPEEFLSHLELNSSRRFLYDAQSVNSVWKSLPLDMSKLEEKFFPL